MYLFKRFINEIVHFFIVVINFITFKFVLFILFFNIFYGNVCIIFNFIYKGDVPKSLYLAQNYGTIKWWMDLKCSK